jgi:hypothetical protein
MEKDPEGFAVTPARRPENETWTFAEKLFMGVMETLTGELMPPCETVTELADRPIEKSGVVAGEDGAPPASPPHPSLAATDSKRAIGITWALRTLTSMA